MPNGGTAVVGGVEVAKLILQAYFSYMEQQNKTQAEIDEFYQTNRKVFYENKPETLKDV